MSTYVDLKDIIRINTELSEKYKSSLIYWKVLNQKEEGNSEECKIFQKWY